MDSFVEECPVTVTFHQVVVLSILQIVKYNAIL